MTVASNQSYQVSSGRSYPLGATVHASGINFSLFSANAEKVELCLFDALGKNEIQRITLPEFTDEVWHGFVEDLPENTLYGYRVYGPFAPHEGHRFNPHKLLLDPYAKQLAGDFIASNSHYAFDEHCPEPDLTLDIRDNAAFLPKCVAVKELESCKSHPQVRRRDTIIYEMHVKGFTKQHPDVPVELQGTFAGLAEPSICQYLSDLGITSVELLPVHSFLDEPFVQQKGLSNYWGYNSLSFFVPEPSYCHSDDLHDSRSEFKNMVETFHQAGIEVILDVVYNHTAEGNELGTTLSFKGIDNASYYRLCPEDKRFYVNHSGCGNTLNIAHPRVLQLVTDSLRYWVEVMGVDGFRFDLAPVLGVWIEILIALSITFLALEILNESAMNTNAYAKGFGFGIKDYPYRLTALFGLIHGCGFALVLREMLSNTSDKLLPLISFNVGIELGQCIMLLVFMGISILLNRLSMLSWDKKWYQTQYQRVARRAMAFWGYSLGIMSMYWVVVRSVDIFNWTVLCRNSGLIFVCVGRRFYDGKYSV